MDDLAEKPVWLLARFVHLYQQCFSILFNSMVYNTAVPDYPTTIWWIILIKSQMFAFRKEKRSILYLWSLKWGSQFPSMKNIVAAEKFWFCCLILLWLPWWRSSSRNSCFKISLEKSVRKIKDSCCQRSTINKFFEKTGDNNGNF